MKTFFLESDNRKYQTATDNYRAFVNESNAFEIRTLKQVNAYQTVTMEAMRTEASALLNEGVGDTMGKIGEGIKNFFKKMIEIIKDMTKAIVKFMKNALDNLIIFFQKIIVWFKEARGKNLEKSLKKKSKVKIHKYGSGKLPLITDVQKLAKKLMSAANAVSAEGPNLEAYKAAEEECKAFVDRKADKIEVDTAKQLKNAEKNMDNDKAIKEIKTLKDGLKKNAAQLKKSSAVAERGLKIAEKLGNAAGGTEAQAKKQLAELKDDVKKTVEMSKAASGGSRLVSGMLSAVMKDSKSVVSRAKSMEKLEGKIEGNAKGTAKSKAALQKTRDRKAARNSK